MAASSKWLLTALFVAFAVSAAPRTPTQDGVVYGVADGQKLTMDYYAPKGPGPHPIAIVIHGGGYQRGDSKSDSEAYCVDFLAPAGYATFSVNYRLAPKYPYPYMVHDVERAVRYLRRNAAQWDADPTKIALVGGSAGGFLSNMVGLLGAPGDPKAADPVDRESAKAQAVVTLFAQSSFATVPLNADVHALLDPLIREKGEAEALREASPITYVSKDAPPFLLIQGDKDEYIPFTEDTNLQAALEKVGVKCEIIRIPGGTHGTGSWNRIPGGPDWERQMTEWLNATLDHQGPVGEGIRERTNSMKADQVSYVQVKTADGVLEGVVSPDGKVRTFKGIPYAAPPVGPLRWQAPQPVTPWAGVRKAADYPPRCMQGRIYADMIFNDKGPSEDCLYLNLWMPAVPATPKLPVMVWIHGGGFVAGGTSEPRQDAGNLSKKGVLVVTLNYRLGIFGFFSHPDLAKESGGKASGNYGLLDQVAALKWVKANIAAFGGDPANVTIFGESAGAFSVSALMASPLAQGLFERAIGESGAFFGDTLKLEPRSKTEKAGLEFARTALGTPSVAALRAKPAEEILQAALKENADRFVPNVDGYFLPEDVHAIFFRGKQAHVPLLAGWNKDEGSYKTILGADVPTPQEYIERIREVFGKKADSILSLYPGATADQVKRSAQDLAGDRLIGYATWKWLEAQLETGKSPVYRYEFDKDLPLPEPAAPHAGEIEYVFGTLASRKLPWRPEDRSLSDTMATYWTNFAKTGDPNGEGLPAWPVYEYKSDYQVMHLTSEPGAAPDAHRARYVFLDEDR